jgi:hypothetical protein
LLRDMVCLRNICVNTLYKGDSNDENNNNNINNYLVQMGCHPVAVITLHVFPNTANKFT